MQTNEFIKSNKVIAIVRGVETDKIADTARALFEGGIRLIEVTFNQSSDDCIAETVNKIKEIINAAGDKICVGAGTVMSDEQVKAAVDAGAQYIISPNTDPEVINAAKKSGVISIPGAFTPSEVVEAYKMGADYVKLFPAGLLGTEYLNALIAPISHIPLMAVGGIDHTNLIEFLSTGISGVGVGSSLVNKNMISKGVWEELICLAKKYKA
jgi:2-dehydro-3-deoxyphosphogluconate aldolase/(4S)-4-hydroxy-2-oxoglutarate aldolase